MPTLVGSAFHAPAEAIAEIEEYVTDESTILRHLLLKLTKLEEAHPVYYHELMTTDGKVVETIDIEAPAPEAKPAEDTAEETKEAEASTETEAETEPEERAAETADTTDDSATDDADTTKA